MSKLIVLGIDPSFSNFGLVKGYLDLNELTFNPTILKLVETKPDKKNKQVRKNSQDLNRAKALRNGMHPLLFDVDLVFVEVPVGSQSARSMASYGVCIGLLAGISLPMVQVMPNDVKIAATGRKTASKDDMIAWATDSYPNAEWFTRTVKGVTSYTKKNEHLADAFGAIHAGLDTDDFKQMLTVFKNLRGTNGN